MYTPPIDHRCMECCYTQRSFTYSRMHIYQGPPPQIDHRSMEYQFTE